MEKRILKYLYEKTPIFEKIFLKYFGDNYDDTELYDNFCNAMENYLYS